MELLGFGVAVFTALDLRLAKSRQLIDEKFISEDQGSRTSQTGLDAKRKKTDRPAHAFLSCVFFF